nr:uncharacterized protein DPEP2NB [Pelodiscus sinensis]|eukprot:XP_025036508.1 uncharacterized protein DPEP2NB [Pelodiscus sinensis]
MSAVVLHLNLWSPLTPGSSKGTEIVSVPSPSSWTAIPGGVPAPCHLCRGNGEALRMWHGETYCHLGQYRCFADLPLHNCHGGALKACPPPGSKRAHFYVEPDIEPEDSPAPKKRKLMELGAWLPGGLPRPQRTPMRRRWRASYGMTVGRTSVLLLQCG